jgi:OTU domain-containing protein 6
LRAKASVAGLRRAAAEYIRQHADDFLPFLLDTDDGTGGDILGRYTAKVEGSSEWGGQIELRVRSFLHPFRLHLLCVISDCIASPVSALQALSQALRVPITVYAADGADLTMGEEFGRAHDDPLRLSFHRHYYALGEHYNSVVPLPTSQLSSTASATNTSRK